LGRCIYYLKLRSGWLARRRPSTDRDWPDLDRFLSDPQSADPETYVAHRRGGRARFFFSPEDRRAYGDFFSRWDDDSRGSIAQADRVVEGEFRYFCCRRVKLGSPPPWHLNPFSGDQLPSDTHWSRVSDFAHGDIKMVWELNRFAFTYPLVRAYWRTGDDAYAEAFWQLAESWRIENPPYRGPNWKCGQEASLRLMAWCFGLYGFLDSPATSAHRVADLARMVALSARRIEANLGYAVSQQNNHGISEATGLWTVGVLFPELRDAARWRRTGRRLLERLGRELIYDDGSFSQHSFNYQRLMLHDYLWAVRLGELNGHPLGDELKQRLAASADLLHRVQHRETGQVPCYGQNDGALILPLNNCAYEDYRPVVQAVRVLTSGKRAWDEGPWNEDLLWLFGPRFDAMPVEPPGQEDLSAGAGGYYTLRSSQGFAFTRCTSFRHRPAQADMLHVDLWWRGQNVAVDAGTYGYNAPEPWNNPLAETAYHNTVSVDGSSQMERVGRFMWLPWLRGHSRPTRRSSGGALCYWQGQHDGYQRLKAPVVHRRGILRLGGEHWFVVDDLRARRPHRYRLHWLLMDAPYDWDQATRRLTLSTSAGSYTTQLGSLGDDGRCTLRRADEQSPRGWRARYYSQREPALSLDQIVDADAAVLWTLFGPEPSRVTVEDGALAIEQGDWHATVRMGDGATEPVIREITLTGSMEDTFTP